MTKKELVDAIANHTGFTKKDCRLLVDVFCDVVAGALYNGDRVKIVDFGIFDVKEVKSKKGKDFENNTMIPIPSRKVPVFVPGIGLRRIVGGSGNGEYDS